MRVALAACLISGAGCGDNEPACGHVEVLEAYRNIWPGHIAVDAERVYYSDYDNGYGTHLVFRVPRDGGQPLVIGARGVQERFGFGMAVDDRYVFWTGEVQPLGYWLLATPVLGGATLELAPLASCTPNGLAVDAVAAYAGTIRCTNNAGDQLPARVVTVPHDGSPGRELWSSLTADVSAIAIANEDVYIATTGGLERVGPSGGPMLVDGHATYHAVVSGDEVVYSTDEALRALPIAGGAPRTLYTYRTAASQPRAFAVDGEDLYIAEPPELVFVSGDGEPVTLVQDIGATVTHITARDGAAYWSTLAVRGSLGLVGTFSGAVMRVDRPCR